MLMGLTLWQFMNDLESIGTMILLIHILAKLETKVDK